MAVEYVGKREVLVNGGTSITIQIPAGASEGDLLIAYIAKDDNVAIYETGDYANWNMLYNIINDSQTCLYLGWRIATADDVSGAVSWTWNADSEDWVGEILCYSGADTITPIHNSGSDFLDSSATPTAPLVGFGQLWMSPTGVNDPDTVWTNDERIYDENTTLYASQGVTPTSWSGYLEGTIDSVLCNKVRFWATSVTGQIDIISLDVYYSGSWHNIYEGAYADQEWVEKAIGSTQWITGVRAKFYNSDTGTIRSARFHEVDFWRPNELTAGSLVLQVFGCDFDDTPRIVPSQLTSRFNQHQATDIGGAGGDKTGIWILPTGFNDPSGNWGNETNAYDEEYLTRAHVFVPAISWSDYMEFTHSGVSCFGIRFYAYWSETSTDEISVDVYYKGAWHNIYEGIFTDREWEFKAIGSVQTVTAMRVKFHNINGAQKAAYLYEVAFFQPGISGTGNTGIAVFGIPASEEWTAATLVIEAASAVGLINGYIMNSVPTEQTEEVFGYFMNSIEEFGYYMDLKT